MLLGRDAVNRFVTVNNANCDDLRPEYLYTILNVHYLCTIV